MNPQHGSVWDGVMAAVVLFVIIAIGFYFLLRWAHRKDKARQEDRDAEAHRRLLAKGGKQ